MYKCNVHVLKKYEQNIHTNFVHFHVLLQGGQKCTKTHKALMCGFVLTQSLAIFVISMPMWDGRRVAQRWVWERGW